MYSAWHVVVLVTFSLAVAGWTGFVIGRERERRMPRQYDATNARAPRPVAITPEIRAELRRLAVVANEASAPAVDVAAPNAEGGA